MKIGFLSMPLTGHLRPMTAARIVYHGLGKSIPVASLNKEDLSGAIQEVLGNPSYRNRARRFQRTIAQTNGLDRAVNVLERAFQLVDESGVVAWENPLDTDAHSASAAACGQSLVSSNTDVHSASQYALSRRHSSVLTRPSVTRG